MMQLNAAYQKFTNYIQYRIFPNFLVSFNDIQIECQPGKMWK